MPSLVAAAALASLLVPSPSRAHTGDALDADGCHADHRSGAYHCHRGAAAGYTFADRAAMLEAVRTRKFPEEKTVEKEGFLSKLWPFGKKHDQEDGSATGGGGAAQAAAAPMTEYEQKLKILQGLYEMGLISREEYEQKRKAVLDEL